MALSHCMGAESVQTQGMGLGPMGPNILCRNVDTGLRQEKGPGQIVPYCVGPVPPPVPVPFPCSVNKP